MHNISFRSTGFRDPYDIAALSVNHVEGKRLCEAMRDVLRSARIETEAPFDEDFGWALHAYTNNTCYLLTGMVNAINPLVEDDGEWPPPESQGREWRYPPKDTEMYIDINIEKHRSFFSALLGQNRMTADDPVSKLMVRHFEAHQDVWEFKFHEG